MKKLEIGDELFEVGELVRLDNKTQKHWGRGKIVSFSRKWVMVRPLGAHKKDEKLRHDRIKKWKSAEHERTQRF